MAALLELCDVALVLGGRRVLSGASLAVAAGEVVGIIGPNGAGKSTLLRAAAGLIAPAAGAVRLDGAPIGALAPAERARVLAYLPQHGESHWAITVGTLVGLGRLPHTGAWRGPGASDRAAVARAMAEADIADLAARPVTELSGGERARAHLARALATESRLLLADEPVAGLDPAHQLDVMAVLRARAHAGAAIAVVLHELTFAARFCDRLALVADGGIAAQGPPDAVLSPENLERAFAIRAARLTVDGGFAIVPVERVPR